MPPTWLALLNFCSVVWLSLSADAPCTCSAMLATVHPVTLPPFRPTMPPTVSPVFVAPFIMLLALFVSAVPSTP